MNDLILDNVFISLVPEISLADKEKLTAYIIKNHIIPEITVWKKYIVDGHFLYLLCLQNHLEYKIKEINLHNKLHAMNWICEKQLTRKDLPKQFEWYLIGKRYIFEQAYCVARYSSGNQGNYDDKRFSIAQQIAEKLSKEYKVSRTSILKYADYAKGIDIMKKRDPEMAENALYGRIDISQNNMILLGNLSNAVYNTVREKIIRTEGAYLKYDFPVEYGEKKITHYRRKEEPLPAVSVKDMPQYDPASKVATLIFTIPKWCSTIERTITETEFNLIPQEAKDKLSEVSSDLIAITEILLEYIKE